MMDETAAPGVARETILRLAYAHASASVGQAIQASEEAASALSFATISPTDASFMTQRDAAERLAQLWTQAARDLAILEAVRGLTDPATYGEGGGEPSYAWFSTRQDLGRAEASPQTDLAPSQVDVDPE